jgi:hypothetical protein
VSSKVEPTKEKKKFSDKLFRQKIAAECKYFVVLLDKFSPIIDIVDSFVENASDEPTNHQIKKERKKERKKKKLPNINVVFGIVIIALLFFGQHMIHHSQKIIITLP